MIWSSLSLFRFVLSLIVLIGHIGIFTEVDGSLGWIFLPYFSGHGAVLGFFIISGYSIAASFQRAPKGFIIRRLIGIYPVYLIGLVISSLPFLFLGNKIVTNTGMVLESPSIIDVIGNVFLFQGFFV
jgi:peptidoglycan/LPS O-acetylase OafA/YrhL